jgi:hypothetical protein
MPTTREQIPGGGPRRAKIDATARRFGKGDREKGQRNEQGAEEADENGDRTEDHQADGAVFEVSGRFVGACHLHGG